MPHQRAASATDDASPARQDALTTAPGSAASGAAGRSELSRRRARAPLTRHVLVAGPILVALLIVLVGGYVLHWPWTGYRDNQGPLKLWDWLEVSLLPLTLALIPVWLKSRGRHRHTWVVAGYLAACALVVLVIGGYLLHWGWTGFTGNTLWDWVKLFLVPFLLPVAFHFLAADEHQASEPHARPRVVRPAHTGSRTEGSDLRPALARPALWVGGAAGLVCVGVVALLAAGGLGHTAAAGSHGSHGARAGAAAVHWVTVNSRDPLWTDTGLSVVPGDRVTIASFGMVLPSSRRGYHYVSPQGLTKPHPGQLSIDTRIHHEALVAIIGAPAHPVALAHTRPSDLIEIGEHRTVSMRTRGELFLGVNDRRTVDNKGWFGATITLRHEQGRP